MKALVHDRYGPPDVLQLAEVPDPVATAEGVVVRVLAASLNPLDWHGVTGTPWLARLQGGLRRPKRAVRGADFAGIVETVGAQVTALKPGDAVYGTCAGSFAELANAKPAFLAPQPAGVSALEAACVPVAAITALQALRDKGRVQAGQRVLVNGAAGGVGIFAVQIAKAMGAHVTGVCSTANVDLVQSLGADRVLDYTRDDFVASGTTYDVIIDMAGNRSLRDRLRALTPTGRCVIVGGPKKGRLAGPLFPMLGAVLATRLRKQRCLGMLAKMNHDDLVVMNGFLESGAVRVVVGRTCDLGGVPQALAEMGTGHSRGKTAVEIVPGRPH